MENTLTNLGNALMIILAVVSFISGILVIQDIMKSKQLKDKRNIRENLVNNAYLMKNLGSIVSKDFIYGHRNTGESPCDLKELEIDDIYLLNVDSVLIDKEILL